MNGEGLFKFGGFVQYSPKIMQAQELLFASASGELLAATCRMPALEYCKPQERLCVSKLKPQELLCGKISGPQVSARTSLR